MELIPIGVGGIIGGTQSSNRYVVPNSLIAVCTHCSAKAQFGFGGASSRSGQNWLANSADCISCGKNNNFLITYPADPPKSGQILVEEIFQEYGFSTTNGMSELARLEKKIAERFRSGDFSGVITACNTYIEKFLKIKIVVHNVDVAFENQGDLGKLYNALAKHLGDDPSTSFHASEKQLLTSLIGLSGGLHGVANSSSDRHSAKVEANEASARFMIRVSFAFCNFVSSRA